MRTKFGPIKDGRDPKDIKKQLLGADESQYQQMMKKQEAMKAAQAATDVTSPDKANAKGKASVPHMTRSGSRKTQERCHAPDVHTTCKKPERSFIDNLQHRVVKEDAHKLERRNSPLLPDVLTPSTAMVRKSSMKKTGPPQKSQAQKLKEEVTRRIDD